MAFFWLCLQYKEGAREKARDKDDLGKSKNACANCPDISGELVISIQRQVKHMDKRRHPRIPIRGLNADISDGKGFFTGIVTDISRYGMSLDRIAKNLDPDADILSVIVDGQGSHFKLLIKQKWETDAGVVKVIGGQIENSPWDWTEFVMQMEPEQDDIWG